MWLFNRKKEDKEPAVDERVKEIKDRIELIKQEAETKGRFSLFHAQYMIDLFDRMTEYDKVEYFYDLIKGHDEKCKIPYEVGMQIDKLVSTERVYIHRTKFYLNTDNHNDPECDQLYSIMNDGLKNYGHTNAGGKVAGLPNLDLTMSPLEGIPGYINLVSSYKDNDTVIIAAFPKNVLKEDGYPVKDYSDIYDMVDNTPAVKPQYIVGALLKKDEGFWDFYYRNEIKKKENNEQRKAM